jgi:hypothetical protein
MSTPKSAKSSNTYSVKYSNKTGGAYADIKAIIQSERENWATKSDNALNRSGRPDLKDGSGKKR